MVSVFQDFILFLNRKKQQQQQPAINESTENCKTTVYIHSINCTHIHFSVLVTIQRENGIAVFKNILENYIYLLFFFFNFLKEHFIEVESCNSLKQIKEGIL